MQFTALKFEIIIFFTQQMALPSCYKNLQRLMEKKDTSWATISSTPLVYVCVNLAMLLYLLRRSFTPFHVIVVHELFADIVLIRTLSSLKISDISA